MKSLIHVLLCFLLLSSGGIEAREYNKFAEKKDAEMKNVTKVIGFILIGAAVTMAWWISNATPAEKEKLSECLRNLKPNFGAPTPGDIEKEIESAERNVRILFNSSQNTFIHRNGERMAKSIEELKPGIKIGETGALIYEEIWVARYNAPKPAVMSESQKKILSRPYRYCVLPVENLNGTKKDKTTTCVMALSEKSSYPALLMIAGPIESDPDDFLKVWPVHRITDPAKVMIMKKLADEKKPFTAEVKKNLLGK